MSSVPLFKRKPRELPRRYRAAIKVSQDPIVVVKRLPGGRALLGRTKGTGKQRIFQTAIYPDVLGADSWTTYNHKGRTLEQQARHDAKKAKRKVK